MTNRVHVVFLSALATIAIGLHITALAAPPLSAIPIIIDPYHLGISTSAWVPGAGINGGQGLVMQKNGPTSAQSYPSAEIAKVRGIDAYSIILGFDYKDGDCTTSSPYLWLDTVAKASDANKYPDSAVGHYFMCSSGTHQLDTPIPGWNRVTFTASDADSSSPIVAGTVVADLYLDFRDGTDTLGVLTPGTMIFGNIRVNGAIITGP